MGRALRAAILAASVGVVGCRGELRAPPEEGGVALCGSAPAVIDRRTEAGSIDAFPAGSPWPAVIAATALIVDADRLVTNGRSVELQGIPVGLCEDERFARQEALGPDVCSGFLVAPDRIATAGHCAPDETQRNARRVVFGLVATEDGQLPSSIDISHVYRISAVAERRDDAAQDLAVLILDRSVPMAMALPLPIASSSPHVGQPVSMVGYPAGMPAKIDACMDPGRSDCLPARVASVSATWFWSDLQAFGGNSGSPVLDANQDVLGVLSSGETQYCVDPELFCLRVRASGASIEKATRVDGRSWMP